MGKQMENETETGVVQGFCAVFSSGPDSKGPSAR